MLLRGPLSLLLHMLTTNVYNTATTFGCSVYRELSPSISACLLTTKDEHYSHSHLADEDTGHKPGQQLPPNK